MASRSMPTSRFAVELTKGAEKDLQTLAKKNPLAHAEAVVALAKLETDPQAGHALAGSLKACRALAFSVAGSGQYRAVYIVVVPEPACLVFIIGPHENIYREAEKRARAVLRRARARSRRR
jgi:mRNA-degrading endonuclease RelE of RelBE toxin-antitoxin system